MMLIADSGSTKTDWCVILDNTPIKRIGTKGLNPFFQSEEEIQQELTHSLLPQLPEGTIDSVYFYGAGCTPEKAPTLRRAIADSLPIVGNIKAYSDMLAAARGLCGREAGITCILGTGSNSCFYDGKEIVNHISPLGFILGDEGSGAVLGKLLVGDILKNQLSPTIKEAFLKQFDLTVPEIIDRVYRQPFPNRFLASLSPFIAQHLEEPGIRQLVLGSFIAFLRRNVMQYDYTQYPAHFIGSVAHCYKEILQEAAQETGIRIGKILQSPMEGLIQYHSDPLHQP
jgi:N-acetylglucosamine kinase-like BadF-type ATPase